MRVSYLQSLAFYCYIRLRRRAKPETMIFEIWSANNNPNAIAPAISVTSSIVLIALPNCNKTRFLVASKASPPGTNGIIPVTMKIIAGSRFYEPCND